MDQIEERFLKGFPQGLIGKKLHGLKVAKTVEHALGDEGVDVGIPFQVAAKSMADRNESGCIKHGFPMFLKNPLDYGVSRLEQEAQPAAILAEEAAQFVGNGEDDVSVGAINAKRSDGGGTSFGILDSARIAKTVLACVVDDIKITAIRTLIKRVPEKTGRTIPHVLDALEDDRANGQKEILIDEVIPIIIQEIFDSISVAVNRQIVDPILFVDLGSGNSAQTHHHSSLYKTTPKIKTPD